MSAFRLRRSLLLRSLLTTILSFVLVALATVAYTVSVTRTQVEQQLEVRMVQLLETVQSTLRVACFVKDRELAREVAIGLLSNSEVLRVTIREGAQTLADQHRILATPPANETHKGVLVRDIHSPFSPGEVIGDIRLIPDQKAIEREIDEAIGERTFQLAWQLALISGAMVVTLLFFIIQPISAISHNLHGMNPTAGERLPVPAGHANTEIGRLVGDVNALASRLVEALDEEHALRLQHEVNERKYHAIFDNAESGIFIVDRRAVMTAWNPALSRLFGISSSIDGHAMLPVDVVHWDDPAAIHGLINRVFDQHAPGSLDTAIRRADGSTFWVNIVLSPVGSDILQGVAHDVSALKEAEALARRQAVTDLLTGLANRAGLEAQLRQHIQLQAQSQSSGFTLLYIDLDKFRLITEGLGVPAGDEILRTVASRLSGTFKHHDTLARVGADIFVVVLQNLNHEETIDKVVERLLGNLRVPYLVDGSPTRLSASIGIALFPSDGADAPSLLRHAELANDKAKADGGDRAIFFDPGLAESAEQRRHLENDLRTGLRERQFVLYYQPIVDLPNNRLAGAEALIRWRHPERGLVPPDNFIPLLEQSGLIDDIGLWVLEEACQQLARWQADGCDYYLSVNVSGRQIPNGLTPGAIGEAINRHGIDPQRLALEITEGILLDNIGDAQAWLQAVRALGVHVYLDDFGTGYSALSYLQRFPLDTLKIDRSFIQDMRNDGSSHALVETIIGMARGLGLSVVAEGVETADQLHILRRLGCQCIQGYYLSRPLPIADFPMVAQRIETLLASA